jgi:hypothetical protein
MSRTLIIDEGLDKRIALQLRGRGRSASSLEELDLLGIKDQPLLKTIAADHRGSVLVTNDDNLPADHRETLKVTRVTVAIVEPQKPSHLKEKEWQYEVIHRWAHQMSEQRAGSVRRYGERSVIWKDRRGRKRAAPKGGKASADGTLF